MVTAYVLSPPGPAARSASTLNRSGRLCWLGERIGRAAAQIEGGWVPAPAMPQEGRPRGSGKLRVESRPCFGSARMPGQYHAGFEPAHRGQQAAVRCGDAAKEIVRFRLPAQDRNQRRAVDDDHAGRPFSSYRSAAANSARPLQPGGAMQTDFPQIRKARAGIRKARAGIRPGGTATADPIDDEFRAGPLQNFANLGKNLRRYPPPLSPRSWPTTALRQAPAGRCCIWRRLSAVD